MGSLAEAFWRALGTTRADEGSSDASLEARLVNIATTTSAAWPGIVVAPSRFCAHLARSVERVDDVARLEELQTTDLYLACACADGDPAALKAFDEQVLMGIDRYVGTVDPSPQFADDVRQNVREELLLPREGRLPKIEAYSGRSPLATWVRVVAVRRALNLKRAAGAVAAASRGEDALSELASDAADPELDFLKSHYRQQFRDAFVAALSELDREQRTALRLHHLDGLTLEEVAAVCRVSRATIARWLADARAEILRRTQRLLRDRLALGEASMSSVYRLVESQLDLSIERYLASTRDDAR